MVRDRKHPSLIIENGNLCVSQLRKSSLSTLTHQRAGRFHFISFSFRIRNAPNAWVIFVQTQKLFLMLWLLRNFSDSICDVRGHQANIWSSAATKSQPVSIVGAHSKACVLNVYVRLKRMLKPHTFRWTSKWFRWNFDRSAPYAMECVLLSLTHGQNADEINWSDHYDSFFGTDAFIVSCLICLKLETGTRPSSPPSK